IPVHFAGAACDMDGIRKVAAGRNIPIVEDSAHAIGTYYKGKHVGDTGHSLFSFHPIKNITTGEGGMFSSDDEELLSQIRRLKFHGLGEDAHTRVTQGRSPHAEVVEPGFKYNLIDFSAALGVVQLGRLEQFIDKRTELAMRYREMLHDIDGVVPLSD